MRGVSLRRERECIQTRTHTQNKYTHKYVYREGSFSTEKKITLRKYNNVFPKKLLRVHQII